ncbi:MAG: hypothetical protein AB7F82_07090 [Alphaproteobacteria bacterium]
MRLWGYTVASLLILACAAQAQQPDALEQKRQELLKSSGNMASGGLSMENIKAMQALSQCIESKVGKKGFARIEAEGKKQKLAIDALCKEGKKDEAMAAQHSYAAKIAQSPEYKAMHECSRKYKELFEGPMGANYKAQMKRAIPKEQDDICA